MGYGDWDEHRLHVIETLRRLEGKVDTLCVDVTRLKARAAIWGMLAGVVASAAVSVAVALLG